MTWFVLLIRTRYNPFIKFECKYAVSLQFVVHLKATGFSIVSRHNCLNLMGAAAHYALNIECTDIDKLNGWNG